jgi:hypothetical protein
MHSSRDRYGLGQHELIWSACHRDCYIACDCQLWTSAGIASCRCRFASGTVLGNGFRKPFWPKRISSLD